MKTTHRNSTVRLMKTKDEESVLKAASERGIQHKKGT